MRALENELGEFFFIKYSIFLQTQYPKAEEFLSMIGKANKKWQQRSCIVINDNKQLLYRYKIIRAFTLGQINGCIGWKDETPEVDNIKLDQTFLNYCSINTTLENEYDIKQWIRSVANNVDSIRAIRNKTAHGGAISSIEEASAVFCILLWVKKVLIRVLDKQIRPPGGPAVGK